MMGSTVTRSRKFTSLGKNSSYRAVTQAPTDQHDEDRSMVTRQNNSIASIPLLRTAHLGSLSAPVAVINPFAALLWLGSLCRVGWLIGGKDPIYGRPLEGSAATWGTDCALH